MEFGLPRCGNQKGVAEDPRRQLVGMKLGCTISCLAFGRGIAETEGKKMCSQLILNPEKPLDKPVQFSGKHFSKVACQFFLLMADRNDWPKIT